MSNVIQLTRERIVEHQNRLLRRRAGISPEALLMCTIYLSKVNTTIDDPHVIIRRCVAHGIDFEEVAGNPEWIEVVANMEG
ncbi:hypothetical protein Tgr7_1805 [Thioalkalivibrio sulfidiphilus HL-EbGr7]|uniref:Uncharacterized protein n=1 Tax=Thioalkalivibrio sulfidiphilus (strain HL-EbGR7) TaxID=396588 RepID=B8GSI3_THISH|nr:hypothetical protein [Thioalkalivibrio sulfidiphilus]ACL72887.1 hypothetical protein Tgr7_1805 [Thioalkalivibrio sulfidiphilus HL-EbGr7]